RIWQRAIIEVRKEPAVRSTRGSGFLRQVRRDAAAIEGAGEQLTKWAVVREEGKVTITVGEENVGLPELGTTLDDGLLWQIVTLIGGVTDISERLLNEVARIPEVLLLEILKPAYFILWLELGSDDSVARLVAGVALAKVIGCHLDLMVTASSVDNLRVDGVTNCLGTQVRSILGRVLRRVVVLGTPSTLADENWVTRDEVVSLVHQQVAGIFGPSVRVGGGTMRYFTELNRVRPQWPEADWISFTLNPQVHSCDTLSLFDNLCGLSDIGVMSRRLFGTSGVAIDGLAPVGGCKPFSSDVQAIGDFSKNAVIRELEVVIACWVLGAVKQLGLGGIDSASLLRATDNLGLVPADSDMQVGVSGEKWEGALRRGSMCPVWHVVRWLGSVGPGSIRATLSTAGTYADALVVERSDGIEMAVYNGTPHFQEVLVGPVPGEWAQIVRLEDLTKERRIYMWDDKCGGGIRLPLERYNLRVVVPPFGVAFAKIL
ncbi:MAG: hypothetical protein ACYCU8_13295, partial [Ferrimicrobium acidiphilum]